MIRRLAGKIALRPSPPLLALFVPLSFVYGVVAALHRWAYRSGLLRAAVLPRPVVSIGNLAVGGGGKTPLTMWLAKKLEDQGKEAGVLTRGYGRSGDRSVIAYPGHDWKDIGDEPALMIRKVKGLPVAVSKNRQRGGEELLGTRNIKVFILDDGFGHHALHKNLEVVVIDDNRRFGSGRLLPAGILREPVERLKEAGIIVVTKAARVDQGFEEEIKKHTDAPVLWADYRPDRLVPVGEQGETGSGTVPEGPFLGFCGIADPESFRISLGRAGVETRGIVTFPDHHPYAPSDVSAITARAFKMGATALVTTEKDGIRWLPEESALPCYVLAMDVFFLKGEAVFLEAVDKVLAGSQAGVG